MTHRWLCLVAHLLIGCLFWPYHYCLVLSEIWRAYFPLHSLISHFVLAYTLPYTSCLCPPFYDLLIPRRLRGLFMIMSSIIVTHFVGRRFAIPASLLRHAVGRCFVFP